MDFLQFLTAIDGFFARESGKVPPAGLGKGISVPSSAREGNNGQVRLGSQHIP
jgi:hypothetical protein